MRPMQTNRPALTMQPTQPPLRRGLRALMIAIAVAVATIGPLAAYVAFGPADGNPIGLGLLAAVGVPVSGVLLLVALVQLAVDAGLHRGVHRGR
jgi:hypothetical protein